MKSSKLSRIASRPKNLYNYLYLVVLLVSSLSGQTLWQIDAQIDTVSSGTATVVRNENIAVILLHSILTDLQLESSQGFLNMTNPTAGEYIISLKPGTHKLLISKTGYLPDELTINLEAKTSYTINVDAIPVSEGSGPSTISFDTSPHGAFVYLDNKQLFGSRWGSVTLPGGIHQIRIDGGPYYESKDTTILLRPGQEQVFKYDLPQTTADWQKRKIKANRYAFIPGMGHFYLGRYDRGLFYALLGTPSALAAINYLIEFNRFEDDQKLDVGIVILASVSLYTISILDYRSWSVLPDPPAFRGSLFKQVSQSKKRFTISLGYLYDTRRFPEFGGVQAQIRYRAVSLNISHGQCKQQYFFGTDGSAETSTQTSLGFSYHFLPQGTRHDLAAGVVYSPKWMGHEVKYSKDISILSAYPAISAMAEYKYYFKRTHDESFKYFLNYGTSFKLLTLNDTDISFPTELYGDSIEVFYPWDGPDRRVALHFGLGVTF